MWYYEIGINYPSRSEYEFKILIDYIIYKRLQLLPVYYNKLTILLLTHASLIITNVFKRSSKKFFYLPPTHHSRISCPWETIKGGRGKKSSMHRPVWAREKTRYLFIRREFTPVRRTQFFRNSMGTANVHMSIWELVLSWNKFF